MSSLPFSNHPTHSLPFSHSHIPALAHQHHLLLQRTPATTAPTPTIAPANPPYQDVWLKLQHLSVRYNDLLRQSRDLASNNQALANEHLRLQKELLAVRTKNEDLSADAVNYRIEAWRANVRLEELSNELQLLKSHKSQLLSLTKRSFEQIDNDGESAWSASCSSPLSSTLSTSTFATPSTATPTSTATAADPSLAFPNSKSPASKFHSPPPYQQTATEEAHAEPTTGSQNSKRRKTLQSSVADRKSDVGDAQKSYSAAATPMGTLQERGVVPGCTGQNSHSAATQRRRTTARGRTHTPSTAAEGPSMRTRSRAKQIPEQEPVKEESKPTADAVAAVVFDATGLPPLSTPVPKGPYV